MDSPTVPGLTLRTPEGRSYRFDPGALCLELLPTGGPGALARYAPRPPGAACPLSPSQPPAGPGSQP
ncbi:hypothetical protein ACWCXB_26770, partial [Streptomyces sp. NPDC001514]